MKPPVRAKAKGYFESFLKHETILTAQIFLRIFEITSPLSNYLQTSGIDLITAHRLVMGVQDSLKKCTRDMDAVAKPLMSLLSGLTISWRKTNPKRWYRQLSLKEKSERKDHAR